MAPRFEHRLFLSATPVNGHTRSFTGLLEMLDPVRFTRTAEMTDAIRKRADDVVIRRLKREINAESSAPRFCHRNLPKSLRLDFDPREPTARRRAPRHASTACRRFATPTTIANWTVRRRATVRGEQIRLSAALGSTTPDVIYRDEDHEPDEGVCVYLDGLSAHLHGNPETAKRDREIRDWLRNTGYDVIEIAATDLDDQDAMTRHFRRLAQYLGMRDTRNRLRIDPSWFHRAG